MIGVLVDVLRAHVEDVGGPAVLLGCGGELWQVLGGVLAVGAPGLAVLVFLRGEDSEEGGFGGGEGWEF